jgi:hypothetical protein
MKYTPNDLEQIFSKANPDWLYSFVTTKQATKITAIPEETLTSWRCRGGGPQYFTPKNTRMVRYLVYHLIEWMLSGGIKSNTSDPGTPCLLPPVELPCYVHPDRLRESESKQWPTSQSKH